MRRTTMAGAVSCGVVGLLGSISWGEPYAPRVGERHGDFVLPRIDDRKPVSLSEFRGTKVLLIHFASW